MSNNRGGFWWMMVARFSKGSDIDRRSNKAESTAVCWPSAPPPRLGRTASAGKLFLILHFSLFFRPRIKEICRKQRRLVSPVCAIDSACLSSFTPSPLMALPPLSLSFSSSCAVAPGAGSKALTAVSQSSLISE